ncbi:MULTISPECIES: hypothetical protein [unclassified Maribacter]|uniref:hypothetical protein n=1 Tax=unclassified Maribacter TaxID=2615042 RepID=UPI00257A6DB7|nr:MULTISPECIES: hypothetical protein [unclassified Maribacter]|tara:strand:- start:653 stop:955 length:303 start_codon:yes stop_codon:yes gene_type:complete
MHYSEYLEDIKSLINSGELDEAEKMLLHCCQLTEEESKHDGCGVAPGYYEKLAIMYSKQKRFDDEISILKRYDNQMKAPGVKPKKLKERLLKAIQKQSKK